MAVREGESQGELLDITEADQVRDASFKQDTPADRGDEAHQPRLAHAAGAAAVLPPEPEVVVGEGEVQAGHREGDMKSKTLSPGTSPMPIGKRNQSMKRKGTIKNLSAMASKSIRNMLDPGKKLGLYRQSKVTDGSEAFGFEKGQKPYLIVHPYSAERMVWDFITFVMLIYCCIMVPYNLAFASENICDGSKFIINSVVDSLFLLDILVNFRTAYLAPNAKRRLLTKKELQEVKTQNVFVVSDAWSIARFYLDPRHLRDGGQGGFFFLDCVGSIPWDWIMCGGWLGDTGDSANVAKIARAPRLLKVLRILRLLRLLRLHRVAVLMKKIRDIMHVNPGVLQLVQFLAMLIISTHWLACMWFFLGTIMDDDDALVLMTSKDASSPSSWASSFSLQTEDSQLHGAQNLQVRCNTFEGNILNTGCVSMSETAQYIVSIYWATTTLTTTGYGDIPPVSLPEIIFSMVMLLIGGFMFAYMVANIALMLDKIDILATQNRHKMFEMEGFMHRERLPGDLRRRIRDYFRRTHMEQRRMPVYLGELSGSLSKEIYLEIFKDIVVKVPFFADFDDAPLALIIKHFHFKSAPSGETLFRSGDFGEWMFFLHKGEIELSVTPEGAGREASWTIGSGSFFGENAILGRKTRITTARTLSWCTMYILSLSDVERTIEKYPNCRVVFEKFKMQMADHNVKRDVHNLVRRWGRRETSDAIQATNSLGSEDHYSPASRRARGNPNSNRTHDGVLTTDSRKTSKRFWSRVRSRGIDSFKGVSQAEERDKAEEEEARKAAIEAIVQVPFEDISMTSQSLSNSLPQGGTSARASHGTSPNAHRPTGQNNLTQSHPPGFVASEDEADKSPVDDKLVAAAAAALGAQCISETDGTTAPTGNVYIANGSLENDHGAKPGHPASPVVAHARPDYKHTTALGEQDNGTRGIETPMPQPGSPEFGHWTPAKSTSIDPGSGSLVSVAGKVPTVVKELQEVIRIQQDDLKVLKDHVKMLTGLIETTNLECQRAKSRSGILEVENEKLKESVMHSISRTGSSNITSPAAALASARNPISGSALSMMQA